MCHIPGGITFMGHFASLPYDMTGLRLPKTDIFCCSSLSFSLSISLSFSLGNTVIVKSVITVHSENIYENCRFSRRNLWSSKPTEAAKRGIQRKLQSSALKCQRNIKSFDLFVRLVPRRNNFLSTLIYHLLLRLFEKVN